MKYRLLALLDKLTLHKTRLCAWVWDYEMDNFPIPEDDFNEYVEYLVTKAVDA